MEYLFTARMRGITKIRYRTYYDNGRLYTINVWRQTDGTWIPGSKPSEGAHPVWVLSVITNKSSIDEVIYKRKHAKKIVRNIVLKEAL